ncbi:DNA polymerase III subunit gamma/tau [Sulfurimonas lithotrophica]|uniref:DNA polymerase III subunit gamma/tau n=1 Tax=Sulfurimonas lithotrophica TaxID=2590022 RepID=A0A5P8P203_9BACT|nr:DNA polymerase III subunit gamma/tau [Sulfurimonas lithotrophica]QFR49763.1 DNA polymerase III subunit gamma/tau [Sulfurimonas lithotrophica]
MESCVGNSEVLARKYRPKNFDELIGQESIAQTLSLALDSNRLSHAYLFSGLRGSGKTSTARIFAKALICQNGVTHQPCGICSNCVNALENRHVDIVEMDAASSRKIDDIRDLIEQTKYKPSVARFKIFIIDEVHMLTKEAFNALLKTLEEPPEYVKFILATTDPLKLPATILSRTQHFRFKSIAQSKVIDHLIHILNLENISYETDALEILARSGSGSLRDTLTLLDQAIIYSKGHVDVNTVTDMLGLVDPKFIAEIFNAIFSKDYAKIVELTKILEDYESEMVVDELIAYVKERMYDNDALFSTLVIDRFFRILSDSKSLFAINADGSFVLSLIFFKMVEALRVKEIDQMIESLQSQTPRADIEPISMDKSQKENTQQEQTNDIQPQEQIVEPIIKKTDPNTELFNKLVENVRDRNAQLGECFEKSVEFKSFENGVLTWESCANEECKKTLRHGFPAIKQEVRELFGFETQIKHTLCSKTPEDLEEKQEVKEVVEQQEPVLQEPVTPQPIPQNNINGPQSTSMVEDAEMGGSASCVTDCQSSDDTKELNPPDIKDDPMVAKAIELFEANKITIQSKI